MLSHKRRASRDMRDPLPPALWAAVCVTARTAHARVHPSSDVGSAGSGKGVRLPQWSARRRRPPPRPHSVRTIHWRALLGPTGPKSATGIQNFL